MDIEALRGRRVLVVVAHQDDESLYFGGLLSTLAGRADLSLISTTAPMPGRPDTETRLGAFHRVGVLLQCRLVRCLALTDCGPRGDTYPPASLSREIATALRPYRNACDIVLTHGPAGEPNVVYGARGHEAHKATSRAVRAVFRGPILSCARGAPNATFELTYDAARKKTLLDCYAPDWTPKDYPFAYDPEPYTEVPKRSWLSLPRLWS